MSPAKSSKNNCIDAHGCIELCYLWHEWWYSDSVTSAHQMSLSISSALCSPSLSGYIAQATRLQTKPPCNKTLSRQSFLWQTPPFVIFSANSVNKLCCILYESGSAKVAIGLLILSVFDVDSFVSGREGLSRGVGCRTLEAAIALSGYRSIDRCRSPRPPLILYTLLIHRATMYATGKFSRFLHPYSRPLEQWVTCWLQ